MAVKLKYLHFASVLGPQAFYRAMHFSAKRGVATACRLSVRPSVTLADQDHIGWKSWKLIALRSPKTIHLLTGEHGEIGGD